MIERRQNAACLQQGGIVHAFIRRARLHQRLEPAAAIERGHGNVIDRRKSVQRADVITVFGNPAHVPAWFSGLKLYETH